MLYVTCSSFERGPINLVLFQEASDAMFHKGDHLCQIYPAKSPDKLAIETIGISSFRHVFVTHGLVQFQSFRGR